MRQQELLHIPQEQHNQRMPHIESVVVFQTLQQEQLQDDEPPALVRQVGILVLVQHGHTERQEPDKQPLLQLVQHKVPLVQHTVPLVQCMVLQEQYTTQQVLQENIFAQVRRLVLQRLVHL